MKKAEEELKSSGNQKLKTAVIGLGHQAIKEHIPAIKASQNLELAGVAETDEKKMKSFLNENPSINGYGNFDELLKFQEIDFIVVAVPHCYHYEVTRKAILNKVHVLKEKPFAVNLSEGLELKNIARKNNVQIAICVQRRFNPIYLTFPRWLDRIGEPFRIDAEYTFYVSKPNEGWRGQRTLAGGGCLLDMGYHLVDLLIWYFGLPDKVFAQMPKDVDIENTARVLFEYEKGLQGSLFLSRVISSDLKEYFKVSGSEGTINLYRYSSKAEKIELRSPTGKLLDQLQQKCSQPSMSRDQLEYFVQVIRGERENINNPEIHLNHLAFLEAAYKSKEVASYVNPKDLLCI